MLRRSVSNPIGTAVYCDTPSLLTTPPSRTTPSAVSSDCSVPTHSTTAWVPSPPASTAESPTAPSPTTVTDLPGPTRDVTTPWWPVQNTSDNVSSDGSSAESSPTGSFTSVPCACGTRTASP